MHICLEEGTLQGLTTPRGVKWDRDVPAGFSFVARTLDEALRAHGRASVGFDVAVAPGALGPGGHKLGIGGSASATVLAAEARVRAGGEVRHPQARAHRAHAGAGRQGAAAATWRRASRGEPCATGATTSPRSRAPPTPAASNGRARRIPAGGPRRPAPPCPCSTPSPVRARPRKLLIGQVEARLDGGRPPGLRGALGCPGPRDSRTAWAAGTSAHSPRP